MLGTGINILDILFIIRSSTDAINAIGIAEIISPSVILFLGTLLAFANLKLSLNEHKPLITFLFLTNLSTFSSEPETV